MTIKFGPRRQVYLGRKSYDYGQTANPQLNRSQLTQKTSTRASGTQSYAYDGGTAGGPGNPTSFKGTVSTFNSDNQVANTGYAYDGNGNPTTYKSAALTFDPENRLASYLYDGDGHQVKGRNSANGSYSGYYDIYDGDNLVGQYYVIGASIQSFATNTFGADGLVSSQGGVFYTFDERGNVAQSLSSTGTVNVSYMYDAYGQVTTTRYPLPFSYGGQWGYQTQGSLILCTHRYYDPNNGRWLTRDPLGYAGGSTSMGMSATIPAIGGIQVVTTRHGQCHRDTQKVVSLQCRVRMTQLSRGQSVKILAIQVIKAVNSQEVFQE